MKSTRLGHLFKRGDVYHVAWRVGGKLVSRSTGEKNRKDAENRRREIMAPFAVGNEVTALQNVKARIEGAKAELAALDDERNPPLTVGGAWGAFVASHNRPDTGKATLAVYELTFGRFRVWLAEHHPNVAAMRDVTPAISSEFADWLVSEGRSPNTFNKYMNLLALVFRTLKDKARLTINPWEGIQRKRLVTYGRRELTIDELRKVCATAQGDLRLLLALGIYTGLRLGDCATLRWGEVDLARGIIRRIPNKMARRDNPKPVILPIHPTLRPLLAEIQGEERGEYVLPRIATDYARHESYVTDRIQALFKSCGIQTRRKIEGRNMSQVEVGFHSLRHSFVSMLAEKNVPQSVTQSLVGHSNPAMTRHYTHTGEAAALAAVTALPSFDGKTPAALPPSGSVGQVATEAVRAIAERLNGKNWKTIQGELLTLTRG